MSAPMGPSYLAAWTNDDVDDFLAAIAAAKSADMERHERRFESCLRLGSLQPDHRVRIRQALSARARQLQAASTSAGSGGRPLEAPGS